MTPEQKALYNTETALPKKVEGKIQHYNLAMRVLRNHHIITLQDTSEMLHYQDGYYQTGGKEIVKEHTQTLLGEEAKRYDILEVLGHVERLTYTPRNKLANKPNTLNLENGLLDLDTQNFKKHTPNHLSTIQLPIKHEPKADCPAFKKFLGEILDEKDHNAVQELFGYCLWKTYAIRKAFMLIGSGANGKSTLLNVLAAMIGENNISGVSLQSLGTDRFALGRFKDKLANIYADIPSKGITNTGTFKMLTGNDPLEADQKFKQPVPFRNHAKLIFSCNQVPATTDDTDAFYSRWIFLNFPHQFPEEDPNTNPHLVNKLTTPSELSGILNWALEGLHRLKKQGKFSNSKSTEEIRERYIRLSDPVQSFLLDCTTDEDPNAVTPKAEFYAAYIDYCHDKSLPTTSNNAFSRKLKELLGSRLGEERPKIGKQRKHCWKGITLVQDAKNLQTTLPTKTVQEVQDVQQLSHFNTIQTHDIKVEKNPDNLDTVDTVPPQATHKRPASHPTPTTKEQPT